MTPSPGPDPDQTSAARRSLRLIMGGGVCFLLGIMALGLDLVLRAKNGSSPIALTLVALLCPIGFAVSFAGLVVQSRPDRSDRQHRFRR